MTVNLIDIAQLLELDKDGLPSLSIEGLCGITDDLPAHLSFLDNEKFADAAQASRIPAFVTRPGVELDGKVQLFHPQPEYAIAVAARLFATEPMHQDVKVHPSASVADDAALGEDVQISAGAVVGSGVQIGSGTRVLSGAVVMDRCRIGADCVIHSNVTVREDSVVGDRVMLQPGCVIGGDGYGFVKHEGHFVKIPQIGAVTIEDDVEVGSNTTIDRGRFTETRIGRGTKIDNLVQIGHNVQIGEDCLIVAQVGISGSTTIGSRVTLAGQVGVAGHLTIADDVVVLGKSVVASSIEEPGGMWAGNPVRPVGEWRRAMARFYAKPKRTPKSAP